MKFIYFLYNLPFHSTHASHPRVSLAQLVDGASEGPRVCETLWCQVDTRCVTRMEPAAEGTSCGHHQVGTA